MASARRFGFPPRRAGQYGIRTPLLYYTKSEYDHLNDPADMGNAFSLIAYLFYEDGTWSNTGDAYTEEELSYFENPETYKENWYGQRFLETRLNLSSDITPRVAESSAIGYNGLALFSYVVDWDDNLATSNDRDVFLQIYNFSEDSFSHIIRTTEESGAFSLPALVRSDNGTYLFYGDKGQTKESGCVRYLNVSYVIQNGLYEEITQGDNEYYVLRDTRSAVTTDSPGGEGMTLPAETVAITADKAVNCGSLSDFDAFVSSDGRMYLLWAALNQESGASDIYASILNSGDESLSEAENGAESQAAWSDAVALTDGGQGAYYSNLDVVGSADGMIVVSGKGQFMDDSANSMVQINHTPYSMLTLDEELTVDNPYASADSDGGSAVEARTTNDNGLVTEPAAPTKSGYAFDGWYLESGTRYDFSTPLTGDTTLKAHWRHVMWPLPFTAPTTVRKSGPCAASGMEFWRKRGTDASLSKPITQSARQRSNCSAAANGSNLSGAVVWTNWWPRCRRTALTLRLTRTSNGRIRIGK